MMGSNQTPPNFHSLENVMAQLADWEIARRCRWPSGIPQPVDWHPMIEPFEREQIRSVMGIPALSFGTSSYGYDARLAPRDFRVFSRNIEKFTFEQPIVDPKNFDPAVLRSLPLEIDDTGSYFVMPPHSYGLGETIETFALPRDILMICLGKSTNARCGVVANVTPGEPGWRGKITLEIANHLPLPLKVYANEGICQFIFLKGASTPLICYGDRPNNYQDQEGLTFPKV